MKRNAGRVLLVSALGCLSLSVLYLLGVWFLFLGGSDVISNVPRPPAPAPQPRVAISAHNYEKIELLYQFAITDSIHTLAWSPDSHLLALAAGRFVGMGSYPNASVHVWDVTNGIGRVVYTRPLHNGPVTSIAFSPDGKFLSFADGATDVKLWNVVDGTQRLLTSTTAIDPSNLIYSLDSTTILAYGTSAEPIAWRVATGQETPTRLKQNGNLLSPDMKTAIKRVYNRDSKPATYQLVLFDPVSGNELSKIGGALPVAFSHNGQVIASVDKVSTTDKPSDTQSVILLTNVADNRAVIQLEGDIGYGKCIAFSPDDTLIAAQIFEPGFVPPLRSTKLVIWGTSSGAKRTFSGLGGMTGCLAFSPDGKYLAVGDIDGRVQVWGINP